MRTWEEVERIKIQELWRGWEKPVTLEVSVAVPGTFQLSPKAGKLAGSRCSRKQAMLSGFSRPFLFYWPVFTLQMLLSAAPCAAKPLLQP